MEFINLFEDVTEPELKRIWANPHEPEKLVDTLKKHHTVFFDEKSDTLFIYGDAVLGKMPNPQIVMMGVYQFYDAAMPGSTSVILDKRFSPQTGEMLGDMAEKTSRSYINLNILCVELKDHPKKERVLKMLEAGGVEIIKDKETLCKRTVEKFGTCALVENKTDRSLN